MWPIGESLKMSKNNIFNKMLHVQTVEFLSTEG